MQRERPKCIDRRRQTAGSNFFNFFIVTCFVTVTCLHLRLTYCTPYHYISKTMPEAPQIDCPLSLGGFFPAESDEEEEELNQCYEVQNVDLMGTTLRIRQFAWHSHNANRVWPGTFNLAEYLLVQNEDGTYRHHWGSVLELGSATGVLAIRLAMVAKQHNPTAIHTVCTSIVTSDVADGEIGEHILHNFKLNDFSKVHIPIHVPHTWGTGWEESAAGIHNIAEPFDTIVASDILLYVSAYPALVTSLVEIMSPTTIMVMSWNRRMKESAEFFERMDAAGFNCHHEGKCIYTCSWKSGSPTGTRRSGGI